MKKTLLLFSLLLAATVFHLNGQAAQVVAATDEGDTWFITGEFNEWSAAQTFTQTSDDDNVFVIDKFTVASLDSYGGFSFQICSGGWATKYSYHQTIGALGTYAFDNVDSPGAWTTAYCTAMTLGTKYKLTWNKQTHELTIEESQSQVDPTAGNYLRGGDISMLNYVESMGAKFYDAAGNEKDALQIMKENGVNIVRLRLYNNPGETVTYGGHSYKLPAGFLDEADVLNLALRAKQYGMKIQLTFHYSDFWTNGEMQFKPKGWEGKSLSGLKTAVYDYTKAFLTKMNEQGTTPEYVSIGNEVQSGLLFGRIDNVNAVNGSTSNMSNVAALLKSGDQAVRDVCPQAKVIIHLTLSESIGYNQYKWFFDNLRTYNYRTFDVIGVSYYPYWTNQKPTMLNQFADLAHTRYGKDLMIMEVGYSWTPYRPSGRYGGNYEGQLHLNGTPYNEASKVGQKVFMQEVQSVVKGHENILGYLYWDPVMVEQQVNGSWIQTGWVEGDVNVVGNTTWYDYEGKALPVFEAIAEDADTQSGVDVPRADDKMSSAKGVVYDLQGRRVQSSIFNLQSSILKKGLYVTDGKKFIVR